MFLEILQNIHGIFKGAEITTTNFFDQLHYKFTPIIPIVCGVLVFYRENVGSPITCEVSKKASKEFMEAYCYNHAMYRMEKSHELEIMPGIYGDTFTPGRKKINLDFTYYISLALFLQAVSFTFSKYVWSYLEDGLISSLLMKDALSPHGDHKTKSTTVLTNLAKNIKEHPGLCNWYFMKYLAVRMLYFIVLFANFEFTDYYLDRNFRYFGYDVISGLYYPNEERLLFGQRNATVGNTLMHDVFPFLAKCTVQLYGPSGSMETHDAACEILVNRLNRLIFVVLWHWYYFLGFVTFFFYVIEILMLLLPCTRISMIRAKAWYPAKKSTLIREIGMGQAFIFLQINRNVGPIRFHQLLDRFYKY